MQPTIAVLRGSMESSSMYRTLRCKPMLAMVTALGLAAGSASAAELPTDAPVSPKCSAEAYRVLDYWIGDWDTFEADGSVAASIARAQVRRIAQGCALYELYEQSDGLIGESILSYDAVRRQWQQTWVTNRGANMVLWGSVRDGALVLEGESHQADGKSVMQRISWRAEGEGVREAALLSRDGGKNWAPAFDVVFRRRAAAE